MAAEAEDWGWDRVLHGDRALAGEDGEALGTGGDSFGATGMCLIPRAMHWKRAKVVRGVRYAYFTTV